LKTPTEAVNRMQKVAWKTITHPPKRKQWNEMTLCRFNKVTVLISLISTMCLWNIRHKWNGFFPLVLSYIRFFLYSSLITGLATRIIRRKPLPDRNSLMFLGTSVHPRFLVGFMLLERLFSVSCFIDRCLTFWTFSFGNCVVCPSNFS